MTHLQAEHVFRLLNEGKELPDPLTIVGDLFPCTYSFLLPTIEYVRKQAKVVFPDDLKILGNCGIAGVNIDRLPKKLKIKGYLNIDCTPITEIPKNIQVDRLLLHSTIVKRIHPTAKIGTIYFQGTDYTIKSYNDKVFCLFSERIYFLREKIICLQKLIEIPELWDEVYYRRKNEFMSLLRKI